MIEEKIYDLWHNEEEPQPKNYYTSYDRTVFDCNINESLCLQGLAENPNLTFDIIRQTADEPWDWDEISANTFPYEKESFLLQRLNRYMAAYRIQQWWFKISLSPQYKIGRKLIEKIRMVI